MPEVALNILDQGNLRTRIGWSKNDAGYPRTDLQERVYVYVREWDHLKAVGWVGRIQGLYLRRRGMGGFLLDLFVVGDRMGGGLISGKR